MCVVAREFQLKESTIRTIRDNRNKIVAAATHSHPERSRSRGELLDKTEKVVSSWIEDCGKRRIPVDSQTIREKARRVFRQFQDEEGPSDTQEFVASKGWFENFKKRNGFKNVNIQGESSSADHAAAIDYPSQLAAIIQEGGYSTEQIFNADET